MKVIKSKISGLKIIKSKIFKDKRGFLKEVFMQKIIKKENFIFDIMSRSKKILYVGCTYSLKKNKQN